jgi:hypothetical protein
MAIAARALRQASHTLATTFNSQPRYHTGCWKGQGAVLTPPEPCLPFHGQMEFLSVGSPNTGALSRAVLSWSKAGALGPGKDRGILL